MVQREVMEGHVWSAIPVRDVSPTGETIALFRQRGTECWWPSHPKSQHPPFKEVTQSPIPWMAFGGCLTITDSGSDYSVSLLWEPDWSFRCWYVDIVRPYERTPIGWDFADHHLDLIVEASGEIWTKDEDDLAAAVERGEMSTEEAVRAHERVEQVGLLAAQRHGVFSEPWPEWRPEGSWGPLRLAASIGIMLARSPTRHDEVLDQSWCRLI